MGYNNRITHGDLSIRLCTLSHLRLGIRYLINLSLRGELHRLSVSVSDLMPEFLHSLRVGGDTALHIASVAPFPDIPIVTTVWCMGTKHTDQLSGIQHIHIRTYIDVTAVDAGVVDTVVAEAWGRMT